MHWPPDIADDLPAPRDDEPSSLRQDIADELADHLRCAFTRELHLARDEPTAQQNALDRFGDPRAIARILWLDALRDKIMSQRLTFVALAIVLLASLGSTAATWFVVEQGRRTNEAMLASAREANETLAAQGRETNAALLKKLDDLSTGSRAEPVSLEWNSVKVRLYSGEKPGKPAWGYTVRLRGHVLDTSKAITVTRTTDAEGMADFGLVRPGQHSLDIVAPWKESLSMELVVLPGKSMLEEFQCPDAMPEKANVSFEIDWPEDLKSRECWLICQFTQEHRVFGERAWSQRAIQSEHFLLLNPSAQITEFPFTSTNHRNASSQPLPWPFNASTDIPRDVRGLHANRRAWMTWRSAQAPDRPEGNSRATRSQPADPFEFVFQRTEVQPQIKLAAGKYVLEAILVGQIPRESSANAASALSFPGVQPEQLNLSQDDFAPESRDVLMTTSILGGVLPRGNEIAGTPNGFSNVQIYRPLTDWSTAFRPNMIVANNELRRRFAPQFAAEEGKANVWKITLPDLLLERVRGNPDFDKVEDVKEGDAPQEQADAVRKET